MLMDGYASWNTQDGSTFSYTYGWTDNDISVGEPIARPSTTATSSVATSNTVVSSWNGRPAATRSFKYREWALGQLVE